MAGRSRSGASALRRAVSSATRAPRKRRERQKRTTPTLMNSSRSARGTRRMIAYSNTSRAGIDRLLYKGARSLQAAKQVVYIGGAVCRRARECRLVAQPDIGDRRHKLFD